MSSKVRVTFWGAAGTVTGSKYLVQFDETSFLVDAGLFQGKKELRLRNWDAPPFDPSSLDAIVLTHAHIDHTGYLPLLVREGFRGNVYCTAATIDLLKLLLPDSAHLQEEEAQFANKHGTSKHHPAKALYTYADVRKALSLLVPLEVNTPVRLFPGCFVRAMCAGHILGACSLAFDINGRGVTFSGDIGRYDVPILPDPHATANGDLLICESTYGDRLHETTDVKLSLAAIVQSAIDRKGALIVPAFAIGRTQLLLYYLAELEREGKIPVVPIYVDSPMATNATRIYRQHRHDFDEEATELIALGETPLLPENVSFTKGVRESKAINAMSGPRIIISASGMINGGRILHHVKNRIDKEETTILFVGYQAEGTRGHTILSGAPSVKIFGQKIPIRAKVEDLSGLSAHGDRDELTRWLRSNSGAPQMVKITHGESEASSAFSNHLAEDFGWQASVAEYGETVEI